MPTAPPTAWTRPGSAAPRSPRRPAAPWRATVLTPLLFAAPHPLLRPSAKPLAPLLPALLLGEVYRRERHWLPCAGLHALFNLMGLLWMPPWLSAAWT